MITTVENTPVGINLLSYVNITGWRIDSGKAIHEKCSSGFVYSRGASFEPGEYSIDYTIEYVTGGYVDVYFGGEFVRKVTSPGAYTATVSAVASEIKMFSPVGTHAVVSKFEYKRIVSGSVTNDTTIAFSEPIDKWTSFYTYSPDCGFSLKRNLFTVKDGSLWKHDVDFERNNIYGIQHNTVIEFSMNQALNVIKNFQSIEVVSNRLMVTTANGIKTDLGQVSDLFAEDFKRYTLSDNVTSVDVYNREGAYFANFLRDKNTNILEGDRLKGNVMNITLTTTESDFKLFSVIVNFQSSTAGI